MAIERKGDNRSLRIDFAKLREKTVVISAALAESSARSIECDAGRYDKIEIVGRRATIFLLSHLQRRLQDVVRALSEFFQVLAPEETKRRPVTIRNGDTPVVGD